MPTRGCDICYGLVFFLLDVKKRGSPETDLVFSRSPLGTAAGDTLLFNALADGDYSHLMFIDSDIVPPYGTLEKLMVHDKDIIAAPVWHFDPNKKDIHLGVHIGKDNAERLYFMAPRNGVERVHYTCASCMLVKRKVVLGFRKAKEEFVYMSKLIPKFSTEQNTDSIFFAKAAKLGFEIWVDWDIKNVVHRRAVDLSDAVLERFVSKRFIDMELTRVGQISKFK